MVGFFLNFCYLIRCTYKRSNFVNVAEEINKYWPSIKFIYYSTRCIYQVSELVNVAVGMNK